MPLYPFLLEPTLLVKVWGGRQFETEFHRQLATDEPYGESWEMHDSCVIANGPLKGRTIGDVLSEYGREIVGKHNDPSEGFPLLAKFIDTTSWLSVQVHPDDAYAQEHENEARGKTEAQIILKAAPDSTMVVGVKEDTTQDAVAAAIKDVTLNDHLIYTSVTAGDAVFIPAGIVHAIGPDLLVYEIQQSSDRTYRLYDWGRMGLDGKPRELHIKKGLKVTRYGEQAVITHNNGDRAFELIVDSPFFKTVRCEISDSKSIETQGQFHILTCIEREAKAHTTESDSVTLVKGQTLLVPASISDYFLTSDSTGVVLLSSQAVDMSQF